jgi:hypothetical protein
MLSTQEAARLIGCCPRLLLRYVHEGILAPPDDRARFRREDVIAARVRLGMSAEPPPAVDPRAPKKVP